LMLIFIRMDVETHALVVGGKKLDTSRKGKFKTVLENIFRSH